MVETLRTTKTFYKLGKVVEPSEERNYMVEHLLKFPTLPGDKLKLTVAKGNDYAGRYTLSCKTVDVNDEGQTATMLTVRRNGKVVAQEVVR